MWGVKWLEFWFNFSMRLIDIIFIWTYSCISPLDYIYDNEAWCYDTVLSFIIGSYKLALTIEYKCVFWVGKVWTLSVNKILLKLELWV